MLLSHSQSWSLKVVVRDELQVAKQRVTEESCGFMGIFCSGGKCSNSLNLSKHGQSKPKVLCMYVKQVRVTLET